MLFPQMTAWPAPAAPSSAQGKLILVEHKLVAANTTTVTFSGLNGDSDRAYFLKGVLVCPAFGAAQSLCWRPNGGAANLFESGISLSAGVISAIGATTVGRIAVTALAVAGEYQLECWIQASKTENAVARRRTWRSFAVASAGGTPAMYEMSGCWNETATNITSIDLTHTVAANILNGSVFTLYKLAQT